MRIAASIFTVSTGLLIAMSLAVYLLFNRQLLVSLDDTLRLRADTILEQMNPSVSPLSLPSAAGPGAELAAGEAVLRLYDAAGTLRADASPGIPASSEERAAVADALARPRSLHRTLALEDEEDYRVLLDPVVAEGAIVGVLATGIEISRVTQPLAILRLVLVTADVLTAAVLALGSYWIARRALAPVVVMTETAERITHGDLHERVSGGTADDELGRLASTFNAMIARLSDTIERERQFTGDASHELRTPLAAIGAGIDVTLARERDPSEYRRVLTVIRGQTTRLNTLADHLLLLARLDNEEIRVRFADIEVGALVVSAVADFQGRHQGAVVRTDQSTGPWTVHGDAELLDRAFLQLLENVTTHVGASARIEVSLTRAGDGSIIVAVEDDGPGIPDGLAGEVFQRFRRGDGARRGGGTGLGLAIVDAIARAHGGAIAMAPARSGRGARLELALPPARGPETENGVHNAVPLSPPRARAELLD